MRRLLGVCAFAAALVFILGLSHREAMPAFAAGGEASPETAPGIAGSNASKPIAIVKGVAARALGLDLHGAMDLTTAAAPDRVFAIASAVKPQQAAPVSSTATMFPIAGLGRPGSTGDGGAAALATFDFAPDSLIERSGIAIAADGTMFIADSQNSTVRSVAGPTSSEPGIIRSVAGRWAPRQNVTLSTPMGVAVDYAGNLYIADKDANAVDVLLAATGQLETLAQVISPSSVAVTRDGTKVFVASPETGSVFAITTTTRAIAVIPGFPAAGATSSSNASECPAIDGNAIAAPKTQGICPAGLAVDGRGNLFVADANAGRILRVDAASKKISVAATSLNVPGDTAFDAKGDLFVSEQGLSRVIELPQLGDPASAISLTVPSAFASPCPQVTNPFTFCNIPSGGTSQQAAFTLTNTSSSTVTGVTVGFIPATTPGNFTVESNGCTATLGQGQSCQINVAFTPQTTGDLTAALSVTDSNPADTATIGLAGTGDDYTLQLASGQQIELTVDQGGTAVFNGQVVPDSVFGQEGESVQLVCPPSATMPENTSCVITPCEVAITAGTPTSFKITFVTSSATSIAAVPPQGSGCTSYGPAPATLVPQTRPGVPPGRRTSPVLLLMASLLAIAMFLSWIGAAPRHLAGRKRLPLGFAVAGFAVAILIGCHHGNSTISGPATPAGTTTMTATGKALDSKGNPLNTSRAMPQVMLDVITAPNGGGGFP